MTRQIPRGPENLYCPLWRKKMCNVCHTCPWWVELLASTPGGQPHAHWQCAIAVGPALKVEQTVQTRQVAGAVESARNEAVNAAARANEMTMIAAKQVAIAVQQSNTQLATGLTRLAEVVEAAPKMITLESKDD